MEFSQNSFAFTSQFIGFLYFIRTFFSLKPLMLTVPAIKVSFFKIVNEAFLIS